MQHTHVIQWQRGADSLSGSNTFTADGELNLEVTVNATTNDVAVAATLTIANLKALFIVSDRDVTLETNSSSAADDTIALKAGRPLMWDSTAGYFDNPFSVDVTALYLSNAGNAAATVKIRALYDATPS
jgi:hypothetical protein